jgi:hypothetical protein
VRVCGSTWLWGCTTAKSNKLERQLDHESGASFGKDGGKQQSSEKAKSRRQKAESRRPEAGFVDEKVEQSIIRRRNFPSQAGLARSFLLPIREMLGLLKQVVGLWHCCSCSGEFLQVVLL